MGGYADTGTVELGVYQRACGSCSLSDLCWPMSLNSSDLQRLQSMVRKSGQLPAGSYLFRAGDRFTAIFAVRSGCIKSHSFDAGGHEQVHGFHLRGEVLGFDAVYPDRHCCSALILESSSVCVIPYRDLVRQSAEFHSLHSQVLRLMSREFSKQLMFPEGSGATQRLAAFLLDINSRLRQEDSADHEFHLPMSREDISNYLGITAETLSRLFAKFRRKHLIDVDRRHICLLDPMRLDLIAQGVN